MVKKKRNVPEPDEGDVVSIEVDSHSSVSPRKGVKTSADATPTAVAAPSNGVEDEEGMGEFEDEWEDEEEDEGVVVVAPDSDDEADGMEVDGEAQDEEEDDEANLKVYLPGQKLEEDEVLVADNSTYEMLHGIGAEWPCLSFDILRDTLGTGRKTFPMTSYIVAGSQAERPRDNKLYIMKLSQLHRTKQEDDEGMDDDDDDDLDEDPILESRTVAHFGGINRVRVMPHTESHIVAAWSETGDVNIFDLTQHVRSLDTPGLIPPRDPAPIYTVKRHGKTEGYGLDWSPVQVGRLLTGDTAGRIFQTIRTPSHFETDAKAMHGHAGSVEDIQWSPKQQGIFASCSVDRTIKIWDTRQKNPMQLSVVAHDTDVNVVSWSRSVEYLIASGSDSGVFSVWDLRNWQSATPTSPPEPAATFKWHQAPVTSIEWKESESSVLAVAGADDQITIWDLALERDAEEEATMATGPTGEKVEVPPQLLFIHQGQSNIKELHWHPQIPGCIISTAGDGFNIFKTINS
ncbi:ribosome biosynthesis protein rrb1 [Borealophlyctis nickersoniae]|nr:ribosome biosynthesis protein rrb1 [Borealophlyctis nickersoniae]